MRYFKHILTLLLVLGAVYKTLNAQQGLLHVVVVDRMSGLPIPNVHVTVDQGEVKGISDDLGLVRVHFQGYAEINLKFSHVSYDPLIEVWDPWGLIANSEIRVEMEPRIHQLTVVEIPISAPEVVFEDPYLHVATFTVNRNGIWVLAYKDPKLIRSVSHAGIPLYMDVRLVLLDTAFRALAECDVPGIAKGLHVDHRGKPYVICLDAVHEVELKNGSIEISQIDRTWFESEVLPFCDSIAGHLLGTFYDPLKRSMDHVVSAPASGSVKLICSIRDEHDAQLFRSQYKYMSGTQKVNAMNLAIELGIDKEAVAGYSNGFDEGLYHRPIQAPMYLHNDTIRVFDKTNGSLFSFNSSFELLDEVSLLDRNKHGKDIGLLQDAAHGNIYSCHRRNSRIKVLRLNTVGEVEATTELTFPFPAQVKVFDGMVYYVHRPFGSLQKLTLYREPLR